MGSEDTLGLIAASAGVIRLTSVWHPSSSVTRRAVCTFGRAVAWVHDYDIVSGGWIKTSSQTPIDAMLDTLLAPYHMP